MADDVFAPEYTGGSTLGDVLASVGGANLSRPAIGASIAQGQSLAGLRTAQTELALQKAQEHVEREQGLNNLTSTLVGSGWSPSAALAATGYYRATGRDPQEIFKAHQENQNDELMTLIADPNTPNAARQAALQALSKKGDVGQTQNVEGQLVNALSPTAPPTVTQTPVSESVINRNNATAAAANSRAAMSGNVMDSTLAGITAKFIDENPNLASNMRSLTNGSGPWVVAAYMAEHGNPEAVAWLADHASGRASPGTQATPNHAAGPNAAPGASPAAPPAAPGPDHGAPVSNPGVGAPVPFDAPVSDPHQIIQPAPGVSLAEQAAIRKDYANSKGAGGRVGFINTMAAHSRLFDMAADELQRAAATGNFTPSNALQVLWTKTFGGAAPTNLNLIGEFLGREAVRATINSGAGTGEERQLQVKNDASPTQMHEAAQTIRALGAHQLRTLDNAARRGGVNILQMLDPQTRKDFGALGGFTDTGASAPGAGGGMDLQQAAAAELARRAAAAGQ